MAILSRVGRKPRNVLLAAMFTATFASMWISNVAAPVLCFGLIQPILRWGWGSGGGCGAQGSGRSSRRVGWGPGGKLVRGTHARSQGRSGLGQAGALGAAPRASLPAGVTLPHPKPTPAQAAVCSPTGRAAPCTARDQLAAALLFSPYMLGAKNIPRVLNGFSPACHLTPALCRFAPTPSHSYHAPYSAAPNPCLSTLPSSPAFHTSPVPPTARPAARWTPATPSPRRWSWASRWPPTWAA